MGKKGCFDYKRENMLGVNWKNKWWGNILQN
jgi:hypothetical protein